MSRPLRIIYEGAWYHVMNRGRRGEKIFRSDDDFLAFIDLVKESSTMWQFRVSAYCLMSNHYHILLQTPQANLSRCMRHINGIYTQRYNRQYGCDGQLFRGRYKAVLVDADTYLLELLRYIHRNPVRAGIVKQVNAYDWTSHGGYVSSKKDWRWLYKDFLLDILEPNKERQRSAYRKFVTGEDNKEILHFFQKKNLPAILGKETFIDNIREKFSQNKQHLEMPEAQILKPNINVIKAAVCTSYNIHPANLLSSRRGIKNEARNVAVFLARLYTGAKLETIGKAFTISNYSTVSSIIIKTHTELQTNNKLKKHVDTILKIHDKGQGQT